MAKCKACGEIYPEGSRFCPRCGTSVADDSVVIAEALQAAQKDFDRDSMATLDKSRITYVCSICGSINRIDQDKCTRCGKPRPRSEYVTALKRINSSKAMNSEAETLVAPLPIQAEPVQEVQAPVVQEPVQPEVKQEEPVQPIVQNVMPVGGQAGAITQPFVVVPYVDSMYPLRQYNPNQLYRYQPYTPEEISVMEAQRKAEELAQRQAMEAAQAAAIAEETPVVCECKKNKKVKSFAIGTLILSIVMFILAALNAIGLNEMGAFKDLTTLGVGEIILFAGSAVILIMGIVGIIHSSVRIAGKSSCRGWIIGLIYLIGMLVAFAGSIFYQTGEVSVDVLVENLNSFIEIGSVVVCLLPSLIHLIVSACAPKKQVANNKLLARSYVSAQYKLNLPGGNYGKPRQ